MLLFPLHSHLKFSLNNALYDLLVYLVLLLLLAPVAMAFLLRDLEVEGVAPAVATALVLGAGWG